MDSKKKILYEFLISTCLFALMSVSVLLVPLSGNGQTSMQKAVGNVIGILFWLGLLGGSIVYILMISRNKSCVAEIKNTRKLPSVFCFFRNKEAAVVDIVLAISIVGIIIGNTAGNLPEAMDITFLFLGVTALYGHFLVNGDFFQYIKSFGKRSEKK